MGQLEVLAWPRGGSGIVKSIHQWSSTVCFLRVLDGVYVLTI